MHDAPDPTRHGAGDHTPDSTASRVAAMNRSEFSRLLGMEVVEARPGWARVKMEVPGKRNHQGSAHGGAIFSLADQAFAVAANLGEEAQVALSAQISYLAPAIDPLTAVAERVAGDTRHSLYRVRVYSGEKLVATFEGVGIRAAGNRD